MKIFKKKEKELNSLNIETEENIDNGVSLEGIEEKIDGNEIVDKFVFLPTNFVVGYYEGMTQKGLKEYINGYVSKYFDNPNLTNYKMMKYDAGYIFEIHDGDSETSYLKNIINSFNNGEKFVIVKIQNRIAKVTKNFSKVTTYLLPENESDKHPDAILPEKGSMKPMHSSGFGFVSFGIAISVLGITSLFLSSLFKTVLSKNETFKFDKQMIEAPSTYIERLPLAVETSYVSKVWFENNQWNKTETKIKSLEMENLEKNNMFVSKISSYTRFVEKCASNATLKECNEDNPFLDRIYIQPNDNISSLSLKNGVIELKVRDSVDYIKFIPEFEEDRIFWTYECSKASLANVCMSPDVKITNISNPEKTDVLVNGDVVKESLSNETVKTDLNIIKKVKKVKEDLIKIDDIVKNPIQIMQELEDMKKSSLIEDREVKEPNLNEIKKPKLESLTVNQKDILGIPKDVVIPFEKNNLELPKNLDLSEIPENIIIE